MKVKMTTCMVGINFVHNYGDIVDFPDNQAQRMIDAALAEPVIEQPVIELATLTSNIETPEKKIIRKAK